MEGVSRFQASFFHSISQNWSTIFAWISFSLSIFLILLIGNDFIHYELTELTQFTTEKVSVVVYVSTFIVLQLVVSIASK